MIAIAAAVAWEIVALVLIFVAATRTSRRARTFPIPILLAALGGALPVLAGATGERPWEHEGMAPLLGIFGAIFCGAGGAMVCFSDHDAPLPPLTLKSGTQLGPMPGASLLTTRDARIGSTAGVAVAFASLWVVMTFAAQGADEMTSILIVIGIFMAPIVVGPIGYLIGAPIGRVLLPRFREPGT